MLVAMPTLRVQLLGDFCLTRGDTLITSVNSPRLQSLLAFRVLLTLVSQMFAFSILILEARA